MQNIEKINFYELGAVDDALLKFAVVIARSNGKYVFCKHRDRDTFENPGGHREPDEDIIKTAERELYEETGAIEFELEPLCVYSVVFSDERGGTVESYGLLCVAEVTAFESELHSEIEKIILTDEPPEKQTYPLIQPLLLREAERRKDMSRRDTYG